MSNVKLAALCMMLGGFVVIVARITHGDLPTDEGEAALRTVAEHPNYALVHLAACLGALTWAVGLVALAKSFRHQRASWIGRLAAAVVLVGAAAYLVEFSIDGYALRNLAEAWQSASGAERAGYEAAALLATTILGGPSLMSIATLWGVAIAVYGAALLEDGYPRWLGRSGMALGTVVFAAVVWQFLVPGFALGLAVYAFLPLTALLWSLVLALAVWRRSTQVPQPT